MYPSELVELTLVFQKSSESPSNGDANDGCVDQALLEKLDLGLCALQ